MRHNAEHNKIWTLDEHDIWIFPALLVYSYKDSLVTAQSWVQYERFREYFNIFAYKNDLIQGGDGKKSMQKLQNNSDRKYAVASKNLVSLHKIENDVNSELVIIRYWNLDFLWWGFPRDRKSLDWLFSQDEKLD